MKIALRHLLLRLNRRKTVFEVEEELQFHIEMLERKYAQQGMPGAYAKAAALKRFGNLERVKKQCVDISRRSSLLRRVLNIASILIALTGLAIHILKLRSQSRPNWHHVGHDRGLGAVVDLRARIKPLDCPVWNQTVTSYRHA